MSRIEKTRDYLFGILSQLTKSNNFQINADFLGNKGDFSLDRIPTEPIVEKWISGINIKRELYNFRGRKSYSKDTINNLTNIGFFEKFEEAIKSNNDMGNLPDIDNILSIKCLNCGTLNNVDGTQATFDIQIEITYIENDKEVSL